MYDSVICAIIGPDSGFSSVPINRFNEWWLVVNRAVVNWVGLKYEMSKLTYFRSRKKYWKLSLQISGLMGNFTYHVLHRFYDDVIKWKHFPRYWPFVRGIHRSPVNSPHKGQWPGALMFSLICTRINGWINNGEAGDLRRHRVHYDVTVM